MKNKIVFIIPSLKAGGAERVISFIANKLCQYELDVILIIIGFKEDAVYDVGNANTIYLNKNKLLTSIFDLIKLFFKIKPQLIFSSIAHVNILMGIFSLFFSNVKFIAREASVPSKMNAFAGYKSYFIEKLMKSTYNKLDAIVCQSIDMKNDFIENYSLDKSKLHVINNPITFECFSPSEPTKTNNIFKFITIGRLSPEKGLKRIIKNLAKIKAYNYSYTIIGSGPELKSIQNLVSELNLKDKVILIPYTKNVLEHLASSDLFIQGSFVEGFPNALLESCSVGTPVLAFAAPGGTREIISEGVNGFIAQNEDVFLDYLLNINRTIKLKKDNIIKSVEAKFSADKIVLKYKKLINQVLN